MLSLVKKVPVSLFMLVRLLTLICFMVFFYVGYTKLEVNSELFVQMVYMWAVKMQ